MGFFDDFGDIEELFNKMGGGFEEVSTFDNGKRRTFRKSSGNSSLSNDFVHTKKNIFLVLDLSNKQVIDVKAKQSNYGDKLLEIIFSDNERVNYSIPEDVKTKNLDWNFNNGILEIKFRK